MGKKYSAKDSKTPEYSNENLQTYLKKLRDQVEVMDRQIKDTMEQRNYYKSLWEKIRGGQGGDNKDINDSFNL